MARSGQWVTEGKLENIALPDSVREVIVARGGRLGPEAGRVLSLAAVIGHDFDLEVLARATKTSEDDLLVILDAAAAVALVRELAGISGRYNFAHALIQHVVCGPGRNAPSAGSPGGCQSVGGSLRRRPGRPDRRAGAALDRRHPTHRSGQGRRLLPTSGRCGTPRPRAGRCPALLRPGHLPLRSGRRPRPLPRDRSGHWARHCPTPDR